MNPSEPQFVERLGWEGVVSAPAAVAILLVLALWTGWALWRERYAVGRGWAAVFWVLRMAAFGCALWMLAGPTQLRIERTAQQQSIAIFADGSESMDVVDAADPADSVRWALAVSDDEIDSPVARCDRLSVALGAALSGSEQLARYVAEHRSTKQLDDLATSIQGMIHRGQQHAEAVVLAMESRDSALAERASRIEALLDGPIGDSLAAIQSALDDSRHSESEDLTARLETLVENVAGARRRAVVLASDLAQQSATIASLDRQKVDRLTRREKERQSLDRFERTLNTELSDEVRIERYHFADRPSPVATGDDWGGVLDSASSAIDAVTFTSASDFGSEDASAVKATNLSAVLEQLTNERANQSTRLALIWSDGRHNNPAALPPQDAAAGLAGLPLFFVAIGNSTPLRDLLVHRVEAPTAVAEKDTAIIDVIVTGFESDGDVSEVVLRKAGVEIERKTIEFSGDRIDARIRFSVPANELGRQEYVVGVEPLDDEVNTANNYMPVAFDVVREHVRVLLADSLARWDFHYL
jgi:hypothetical protein